MIFAAVDFDAARRVIDFGCGHAADLITLAEPAPHLELDGFTISAGQVEVGQRRVARLGLADRIRLHHRDSARDPFPGRYDVIFGVEVAGLIEDKQALFDNIAGHLEPGGALVIADFVATTDRIARVDTASFTPTAEQWAELLAAHGLRLTDCVDVSVEIAQFLDDPGFAAEVDGWSTATALGADPPPSAVQPQYRQALRRGLMRYVILAAHHEPASRPETLRAANEACSANPAARHAAAAGPAPELAWFYRVDWRRRPMAQVAEIHRGKLDGLAPRPSALDRLARRSSGRPTSRR